MKLKMKHTISMFHILNLLIITVLSIESET